MMKLFLKFELGKIRNYFKTRTLAKIITSLLFLGVFLFVAAGIYIFFVSGFRFINAEAVEDIRMALTLFIYESFLLVLAGIVVLSALISGIFNLFRGDYNTWIISSPGYKILPRLVLVRSILSSSLPLLIVFLPAMLAFTKVNNLHSISILFVLLSVILFLVLLNALTLTVIIGVGTLYRAILEKVTVRRISIRGLISVLFITVVGVISFLWKIIKDIDLVALFKAGVATDTSLSVSNIGNHFIFLPTHPFAMEILSWQSNQSGNALEYFFALLVLAIISVVIWFFVSPLFYPLWLRFQDGTSSGAAKTNIVSGHDTLYRFSGNTMMALFKKEALIASRNWKGVLWFLFLFFIWLLQIGANIILDHNIQKYQPDVSQKVTILQSLQFIIAIYFISSFALRFVFPAFSVEKKTAWILGTAPLNFRKIFFSKYLFYIAFFTILGTLMSSINAAVLGLPFEKATYSLVLLLSTIIFIVTLGLSLGALFPNKETDDPEVISTSMSGLFFTALSLTYGAISTGVLYVTVTKESPVALVLFVIVTLFITAVLLFRTPKLVMEKSL